MKNFFSLFFFVAFNSINAQSSIEEAKKYIEVPGGVQNIDKKVLKNPCPQAFPYIALRFRTGSTELVEDGRGSDRVTAKTYALLENVDSALCQEITNEFAILLMAKLKEAGVTIVELEKIRNTKSYKKFSEEQSDRNFNHKNYGTSHVYTDNNSPFFYYPINAIKVSKFVGDVDGGAAFLRLTIDFVEFDTEVRKTYGWDVKTTNFSAKAFPTIKVTSDPYAEGNWNLATGANKAGGLAMMDHKRYFAANFIQKLPVYEKYDGKVEVYDSKVPKFAGKRYSAFAGGLQLGTFVIEAEKSTYKAAAMKALSHYADYVIATIKSYND